MSEVNAVTIEVERLPVHPVAVVGLVYPFDLAGSSGRTAGSGRRRGGIRRHLVLDWKRGGLEVRRVQ